MSFLNKKRRWLKILHSRITLGILLVLCVMLGMSVFDRFTIERDMANRRATAEAELQSLHERKAQLQEKVDYLSADAGIEAEIRKHFDVVREGEQVVVILDEDTKDPSTTAEFEVKPESFWSRFLPW